MDRQVTCPTCHERQPLPDPDGYTCISCGTAWHLVACGSCGARFHMRPETTAWTCPSCGANNETPAYVAPSTAPARGEAPTGAPAPARRAAAPGSSGRGPMFAIVAGVVVLIVVVWAVFFRNSGGPTEASASHTSSPSADALTLMCTAWTADMPLRVDSLTRAEDQVRAAAKTLAQQGNTQAAKAGRAFADALDQLVTALDSHGETSTAIQQVGEANGALPC